MKTFNEYLTESMTITKNIYRDIVNNDIDAYNKIYNNSSSLYNDSSVAKGVTFFSAFIVKNEDESIFLCNKKPYKQDNTWNCDGDIINVAKPGGMILPGFDAIKKSSLFKKLKWSNSHPFIVNFNTYETDPKSLIYVGIRDSEYLYILNDQNMVNWSEKFELKNTIKHDKMFLLKTNNKANIDIPMSIEIIK